MGVGMSAALSGCACGEIIHVRQILQELWVLKIRILTYFSLSAHSVTCMNLIDIFQDRCTTSLAVHIGYNPCSEYFAGVTAFDTVNLHSFTLTPPTL